MSFSLIPLGSKGVNYVRDPVLPSRRIDRSTFPLCGWMCLLYFMYLLLLQNRYTCSIFMLHILHISDITVFTIYCPAYYCYKDSLWYGVLSKIVRGVVSKRNRRKDGVTAPSYSSVEAISIKNSSPKRPLDTSMSL